MHVYGSEVLFCIWAIITRNFGSTCNCVTSMGSLGMSHVQTCRTPRLHRDLSLHLDIRGKRWLFFSATWKACSGDMIYSVQIGMQIRFPQLLEPFCSSLWFPIQGKSACSINTSMHVWLHTCLFLLKCWLSLSFRLQQPNNGTCMLLMSHIHCCHKQCRLCPKFSHGHTYEVKAQPATFWLAHDALFTWHSPTKISSKHTDWPPTAVITYIRLPHSWSGGKKYTVHSFHIIDFATIQQYLRSNIVCLWQSLHSRTTHSYFAWWKTVS